MGLFSNLRKQTGGHSVADQTAKAVLAMPLLVAASDGRVDDSELDQIINMCAFSPIFHAVGAQRTKDLLMEIAKDIRDRGAESLFSDVKATLTPKMVETAMCFAIRTALADGVLEQSEKDTLIAMGSRLALPPETFTKIFDVMAMLQRPAQ